MALFTFNQGSIGHALMESRKALVKFAELEEGLAVCLEKMGSPTFHALAINTDLKVLKRHILLLERYALSITKQLEEENDIYLGLRSQEKLPLEDH